MISYFINKFLIFETKKLINETEVIYPKAVTIIKN